MRRKIITKDFILRPFRKDDEFSLAKNINDKEVIQNTIINIYPYKLKDAKDWVKKNLEEDKKRKPKMINFVIDIDGEVAGSVGFVKVEEYKAEIGYWLAKKYWNKGTMTRAVKLTTKFGFEKLRFRRIYAYTFSFNKRSARVLEKSDYKFEGILKKNTKKGKKFIDDYLFARVR